MSPDDRKRLIERIRKCLALAKSANEHEAAVALGQAQKLMQQHGVDEAELLAHEATESSAKARATSKPSAWEARLAQLVADAFGCDLIFSSRYVGLLDRKLQGSWLFVGCAPAPEIAEYAFTVLLRQLTRARSSHIKSALKRCGPSSRTRRADLFCSGWVRGAAEKVQVFARPERVTLAIAAFKAKQHPQLGESLKPRDRNADRRLTDRDLGDYSAGARQGRSADLRRPMTGGKQDALGFDNRIAA